MKIVYIVGSLAQNSLNRTLAETLVELAPHGVEMVEAPIRDLPLFNRDLEQDFPPVAAEFKSLVASADGILFVTPEHNRSYSAAIHNAIEWTSRPYGQWALAGKPVATIGVSPSGIGTAVAQQQLRSSLLFFGTKVMGQPEGYVDGKRAGLVDHGKVTDEAAREVLAQFISSFTQFVQAQA
ncbi:NADPH-dependent FMN reductase [Trueperella sp. LYQ143]|uniref:NADPH-dependent FMN reductase n=1 Tax=unclassified Trueperella TaxID=2630174 RepID=UPI003983AD6C